MMSCPTAATVSAPSSPRPRRKTAKAAAETISKVLDTAEDDTEEEEYAPSLHSTSSAVPPASPKSRTRPPSNKRRSATNSSSAGANPGKKCALSPETTEYLKNWMLHPDHIDHPYPTEEEKAGIMRHCGIEMKQLTNWFVNNRKRIWKPKLEELKKRRGEDVEGMGTNVSLEGGEGEERDYVKRKKTGGPLGAKTAKAHSNVKAANKKHVDTKGSSSSLVNNPLADCSLSVEGTEDYESISDRMPPLPPPQVPGAATVTPLVDPIIISAYSDATIGSAPLLPMTSVPAGGGESQQPLDIMPHSCCNLVDKMNRYVQPCALCLACRDWNAGEFCPWDLTGIIGDISDDISASATELTDVTVAVGGVKEEEERSGSIVSEESGGRARVGGGNATSFTAAVDALSSEYGKDEYRISAFPSTASFPVPQEIGQGDLISDIVDMDVAWENHHQD